MIVLGLRLGLAGGRRAVATVVLTTLTVASGAALLLFALTVAPALQGRADRTAWMNVDFGVDPSATVAVDSPLVHTTITTSRDHYHADSIDVVAVAGFGVNAPVPQGLPLLPRPAEALVSPRLRDLMAHDPRLADRYGRIVGNVGSQALAGPDALVAVQGVPAEVAGLQGVAVTTFPQHGRVLQLTGIVRVLLLLGAVAMLAPIALLVSLATRLSATTRDRRLAALRLTGATNRQVARLAAIESVVPGVAGAIAGAGLFFALRPAATHVTYDGGRWFTADLNPGPVGFTLVVICVPLVTALATQVTLSRVVHSPLGVVRQSTPKRVSAWRLLPLVVAVPMLGTALRSDGASAATGGRSRLVLVSFLILLLALLHAGPCITRGLGLLLAQSRGPARLLAGRPLG